jgi:hypothetical protein
MPQISADIPNGGGETTTQSPILVRSEQGSFEQEATDKTEKTA